jgi:HK97 family phage major capsid protein
MSLTKGCRAAPLIAATSRAGRTRASGPPAGLRILRDPYSAKPYVLFYTTKRVGGGVQDYAAIKLLNFAA